MNAEQAAELLDAWCGATDTAALRRDAAGRLIPAVPLPDWFERHVARVDPQAPAGLNVLSSFFEHALDEAQRFLDAAEHSHALDCGIWEESCAGQREFFQAHALRHNGRRGLIVRRLGPEFSAHRERLQTARDQLLEGERLEALVRARTHEVRAREEQIALRLLYAVGARDKETGAHVRRLGLYAAAVAECIGWSAAQVDNIRVAAPMHDIGKIGIPDAILQKPAALTDPEWRVMQTHAAIGGDMLASDIPLLAMAADIARHHHERWDGSGYPDGLAAEATPEAARIVAIADVYDALVHARVYKPAWDEDSVLDELQRLAGSHFDPRLLAAFLERIDTMRQIRRDYPDER